MDKSKRASIIKNFLTIFKIAQVITIDDIIIPKTQSIITLDVVNDDSVLLTLIISKLDIYDYTLLISDIYYFKYIDIINAYIISRDTLSDTFIVNDTNNKEHKLMFQVLESIIGSSGPYSALTLIDEVYEYIQEQLNERGGVVCDSQLDQLDADELIDLMDSTLALCQIIDNGGILEYYSIDTLDDIFLNMINSLPSNNKWLKFIKISKEPLSEIDNSEVNCDNEERVLH